MSFYVAASLALHGAIIGNYDISPGPNGAMMDAMQTVLLGFLQGVTEWIPVSSEGQTMLVMMKLLGITPAEALSYSILLHIGTMSAVLIKFRGQFLEALKNITSPMARILVICTICTGITGMPLYFLFKESFSGGREATLLIGGLLILTGLLLRFKGSGSRSIEDMKPVDMILLGLAQGFSILPGVSRSGTTLTVLLMRNIRQDMALVISFMISVPAVLGALVLDHSIAAVPFGSVILAILASFVTGYLCMDLLILFAEKVNFSRFCIAMGLITLLLASLF
ncbi:MAG TPA: undecaprenyl-diphosphate phosphatase [Methanothrix sp.]|nr:undecaprenyl-diphosphate phosphatase [Methanothrix sp.]